MYVSQIHHLSGLMGIEILSLVALIKDEEFSLQGYWDYLKRHIESIGLFGAFETDGRLVGIVHMEKPGQWYPERGFIQLAAINPEVDKQVGLDIHKMAENWVKSKGATYIWGWTKRQPRAVRRKYGYRVVKEKQMIKGLSGDTYKHIELQEPHDV